MEEQQGSGQGGEVRTIQLSDRAVDALESIATFCVSYQKQARCSKYFKGALWLFVITGCAALIWGMGSIFSNSSTGNGELPVWKNYYETPYRVRVADFDENYANLTRLFQETKNSPTGAGIAVPTHAKIAVIPINGPLIRGASGSSSLFGMAQDPIEAILDQIDIAATYSNARAVILDINSPGGEVGACDEIRDAILRLKQRGVPVVAYARGIMASGAYYIAADADAIIASPTAIVGSIGVVMELVNVEGLAAKIGVTMETIKSSPMKDIGSPFKRMSPQERAVLQRLIDDNYQRFRLIVKNGRGLSQDQTDAVSNGAVFTAADASKKKLVNSVGDLKKAVITAALLAQAGIPEVVTYKRRTSLWQELAGSMRERFSLSRTALSDMVPFPAEGPRLLYQWKP